MSLHHKKISYKDFLTSCLTLLNNQNIHFTGDKPCVNPSVSTTRVSLTSAGKNLGELCLFKSRGDAKSLKPAPAKGQEAGLGILLQGQPFKGQPFKGQLRRFSKTILLKAEKMRKIFNLSSLVHVQTHQHETKLISLTSKLIFAALFLGILFCPKALWAVTDGVLSEEVVKIENLLTGGYMRLGLLGVCGFAAIYGVVKQSGWMFVSGIMGCVFVYFMKDWILKTFTAVV